MSSLTCELCDGEGFIAFKGVDPNAGMLVHSAEAIDMFGPCPNCDGTGIADYPSMLVQPAPT